MRRSGASVNSSRNSATSAPAPATAVVSARMKRVPRRDTSAELALSSALHGLGLRFRIDQRVVSHLPYRADVVFRRAQVAVFIDGCFWHGCPQHATSSRSNAEWWRAKIARNRNRDKRATMCLRAAGWTVIRCWAHEDVDRTSARIRKTVERRVAKLRER